MKKLLEYLKERRTLSALLIILIAIVFYMLLANFTDIRTAIAKLFSILSPLFAGAFLAYLLDPFARLLDRTLFKKIPRRRAARVLSVLLAFFTVLAVFIVLLVTIVPQVLDSLGVLLGNIGGYFTEAEAALTALVTRFPEFDISLDELFDTWSGWLTNITTLITDNLNTIIETSYRAGSRVFNFVLSVVMSLYILLDKENIFRSIKRWAHSRMKLEKYDRYYFLLKRADGIFIGFLGGNVLDCLIVGMANFIVMKILGMPYALLISVIVGVTNFIPTFGPIIGAVPSLLILLLIKPMYALEFLILAVVLQTLDPYLLKPLLFGDATGLRPLWVLAAVIIGGRLFGVWGMVFGIPMLAVISQLMHEGVDKRLERLGLNAEGEPVEPAPPTEAKISE